MQQPTPIPYFYQGIAYNPSDGGGGVTHQWGQALPEGAKPQQFPPNQWDNNGAGYPLSGGSYGGPGANAGGQGRGVPGAPQQQHPPPSQPTPTSTPPIDISKQHQQQLMQNQQPQMNFVRPTLNPAYQQFQQRPAMQPNQIRNLQARPTGALNYIQGPLIQGPGGVLTPAPTTGAIIQTPGGGYSVMYPAQPRQTQPAYNQPVYMQQYQHYPPYYVSPGQFPAAMASGGPSPQPGAQPPPVQMQQRPVIVPPPTQALPPPKAEPKRPRPNAIKIIDPSTNEEVPIEPEASANNNNVTPTRSNDSSARETPQLKPGPTQDNTVAAEFAARVAAVLAPASSSPSPSPIQSQAPDTPTLSDSETHHKQPTVLVPNSSEIIISNTVLSSNSMEFVPRSQQAQVCELPPTEEKPPAVPTVSAETNAPAIEIQRKPEPVKSAVPVAFQSPSKANARKQKGSDNERQPAAVPVQPERVLQPAQPQPPTEKDNASAIKKGPKPVIQKEECATLPKERREKTRSVSKEQPPVVSPAVTPDIASSQPEDLPAKVPLPAFVPKSQPAPAPVAAPVPAEEPVPTKSLPHHNGETGLPESVTGHDGGKSTKHKKKNVKMRELNRKGVDKEGSDMDAFTTEAIVNEERPATPASPVPPAALPSASAPAIVPPEPAAPPPPHVDKIKEDLEEKEDKLVAAKNEENAKVSTLAPKEEKELEPPPVIEKEEKKEKPHPPPITLRHSYTKDQWSPLNQAGKKKYDRDFLLELKSEPQSMVKPDGLPDVVASLMRNDTNNANAFISSRNSKMIMPEFARSSQSQRGGMPPRQSRGSQQGMKRGDGGSKGGVKVIHMSLSSDQDVKLKTTENAWKPNRIDNAADKSEEERQTDELYKNVRGILNKLTPQKFETLINKFLALPINSENRLQGVIKLIFEKAVDEPSFSTAYANMCKVCSKLEVSKEMDAANENSEKKEEKVSLRKLLINRCQQEFESNTKEELNIFKWLGDIDNCNDPEMKKVLQLEFEEKERKIRMKSVGNIRFIGELFKLGMLTPAIMYRCIEQLLSTPDEESLECLCKLLTTIGRDLEYQKTQQAQGNLNPYFSRMADLAQKKENSKVSSRVRFMLRDVIDLRNNKWVPRREDSKPKTIEQINKEVAKETMDNAMAMAQPPPPRMRQGDRQDDRKGGRGPRGQQSDDGWNTVGGSRGFSRLTTPAFDAQKMSSMSKPEQDLNSVSLGGSSMFAAFGSMGAKKQSAFTSTNAFSVLNNQDKKPSNISHRRVTPSTSMERDRERQRMIQGVSEGEGRNSRGSSMQRERLQPASQPPSRDSSLPRQTVEDNREAKLEDKPTRPAGEEMSDEKLERHTVTIFEEYMQNLSTVEDIKLDLGQYYVGEKRLSGFVEKALSISLDKKPPVQNKIGTLLAALLDYNVIPVNVFVEQLTFVYEVMDDIAIDVPKVWELQAHVVVPIIAAEKINFSHFKEACKPIQRTDAVPKLLVPVLQILSQTKGEVFARKVWDLSNVSIKDFMAEEGADVNAFITKHLLGFLVGEAPKPSMDEVHEKMKELMQKGQPYEKIVEFISSNIGDKVDDLQFIRALIIAICESCLTGSNMNFDREKFITYEKLITRFVDTKEDRELAALNAVHLLMTRLQYPQGLLTKIFNLFLDENLITPESFLKWRNDEELVENKGVSILSLTSFFSLLEGPDTDEDNS